MILNRKDHNVKRIIVISDLHGCFDELTDLLNVVKYDEQEDFLIGQDIVDKGPKVRECYDFFFGHPKRIVLDSNHENKHLRRAKGIQVVIREDMRVTIDQLSNEECLAFEELPLQIVLPEFRHALVHGGLLPNRSLEKQADKKYNKHVRFLRYISENNESISLGEEDENSVFWATKWRGPEFIIFGHDWNPNIRHFPFATGIDTGCVYGNNLTAVIFDDFDKTIVQIPARKRYINPVH